MPPDHPRFNQRRLTIPPVGVAHFLSCPNLLKAAHNSKHQRSQHPFSHYQANFGTLSISTQPRAQSTHAELSPLSHSRRRRRRQVSRRISSIATLGRAWFSGSVSCVRKSVRKVADGGVPTSRSGPQTDLRGDFPRIHPQRRETRSTRPGRASSEQITAPSQPTSQLGCGDLGKHPGPRALSPCRSPRSSQPRPPDNWTARTGKTYPLATPDQWPGTSP